MKGVRGRRGKRLPLGSRRRRRVASSPAWRWTRTGRGRKLSGDQITLPTTVDYSLVPKQSEVEDWTSWDEDAPTSVKIEGGNGDVANQQNGLEEMEPDYFKDMTPTIRKTQKIIVKKREPLSFGNQDVSAGFSSRLLAATQDTPFIHQSNWETWRHGRKTEMLGKKKKMPPGKQKRFLGSRK
ncbi:receptor-binding cancer antigen expressed on SiSo cells isoform X3 [Podarcis muralis]